MCAFTKCCCLFTIRTGLIIFSVINIIYGIVLLVCGGYTIQEDVPSIVCLVTGSFLVVESLIVLIGAITRHHIVLFVSLSTTTIVLILLIIVGTLSFTMIGTENCELDILTLNGTNITKIENVNTASALNNTIISTENTEDSSSNEQILASFFLVFAFIHGYTVCMMYSFYLVISNANRGSNDVEMVPSF